MKKVFFILLILLSAACAAVAQNNSVKGSGVIYTNGAPTLSIDSRYHTELAIDTATGLWYEHSRDGLGWIAAGFRIQKRSGCTVPTAAPLDKQSEVVLNDCDSLYRWRAGAWHHLNPGSTYTAGSGINISGGNVISNTGDLSSTNEIQTLSAGGAGPTQYTVDLSLGGGSVTLKEGTNVDLSRSGNEITITSSDADTGTVTSVNLTAPTSEFDVSGVPITSAGTIALTWDNQAENLVFASPVSGGSGQPSFRSLNYADFDTDLRDSLRIVVIRTVGEFANYPANDRQEIIYFDDAKRGGWFVLGSGTVNNGTVFAGAGTSKWVRHRPYLYADPYWFGAAGNGTTDDTAPVDAALDLAIAEQGTLIFRAGAYLASTVTDTLDATKLVIRGEGSPVVTIKRKDSTLSSGVGTAGIRLFRIFGKNGATLEISGLTFDGNYQGQPTPSPVTEFQQAHSLAINPLGTLGFTNVFVDDIVSKNPVGDGVNIGGSSTDNLNSLTVSRVVEYSRPYTRATVGISAQLRSASLSHITATSVEVEPNGWSATDQVAYHLDHITTQELDYNFLGAHDAGIDVFLTADNLFVNKHVNIGECFAKITNFYFRDTAEFRMQWGEYQMTNGVMWADSAFLDNCLVTQAAANPTAYARFTNVVFRKDTDAGSGLTSYFKDDNAFGTATRVIEFSGCSFEDAVPSARIRAGKFSFYNCRHTLTDTTTAAIYTSASTTKSGVTNEVIILDNTLPTNSYLFRPSISGTAQKFRVQGGNAVDGHNVLWDRFDKIDAEALPQNLQRYDQTTTTALNASDFPKQGRWRKGDRLYYKDPAARGAEYAECTVSGRADGVSATGATSGASFKKSGLHAVNTTGAVNGQVLKYNGSIWVPGLDADSSATNESLTINDGVDSENLGGQTLNVIGAGSVTTDYQPATNTLYVSGTDQQTLTAAGTTSPTITLGGGTGGGGTVTFSAGTGITLGQSGGTITITNANGLITASNGLTLSSSDVKLGGTLTANTTIDQEDKTMTWTANTLAGANGFSVTSNSTAAASNAQTLVNVQLSGANATSTQTTKAGYFLNSHTGTSATNYGLVGEVQNGTGSSAAVRGVSTTQRGIQGETTSGTAGWFNATSGKGIEANVTGTNPVATFGKNASATNSVVTMVQANTASQGTAAAGFGGAWDTYLEASDGSLPNALRQAAVVTDPTAATFTSEYQISLQNSNTLTLVSTLFGTGRMRLHKYGVGTFTGTPAYNLQVDASGYLIESSAVSGGSSYYQTVRDDGVDMTQRAALNFTSGSDINFTLTDDGANGETEVLADIPVHAVQYGEIQQAGASTLIGNPTGSTADVSEITLGSGLSFVGTVLTPADASATNEIQTLSASGSGPFSLDLSLSGGSVTLTEGTNIDISRTGNNLTINATAAADGNGIYGDETTPGTGDGNLPPGGSTVTTNGYPLEFTTNTAASNVRNVLQVTIPYSADDAFTNVLSVYTPIDSLKLYNFDGDSYLQSYSGSLNLVSGEELNISATDYVNVSADSVQLATVPTNTKVPAMVGINSVGTLKKLVGTNNDDVIKWSSGGWVVGAAPTGSGPTGSGTANYVTYWTGASTLAGDVDFQFDGTRVGIQGAPVSGFSLYTGNAIRADGSVVSRGTGNGTSSTSAAGLRLWNTTASTGDTYNLYSANDGTLILNQGAVGDILKTNTLGDFIFPNAINQTVDAAPPSAPTDGVTDYVTEYSGVQDRAWIDENGQVWERMASEASAKWAKWSAAGNGTAVSTWAINNSESGTPTTVNIASTNLFTSMRRLQYKTAASSASVAGTRHNNLSFWRGNASGLGGFYFVCRFGFSVANTTNKQAFIGFRNSSSAIAGNTNPSSLTNCIYFGIDATQTTLRFGHNDGSGTATTSDLGANFPTNTNSADMYEVRMFAAPNAGTVYYWAKNLSTGNVTSGNTSTDLPSSTTFLCPAIWISNGSDATAVGIDVVQYSILTNY